MYGVFVFLYSIYWNKNNFKNKVIIKLNSCMGYYSKNYYLIINKYFFMRKHVTYSNRKWTRRETVRLWVSCWPHKQKGKDKQGLWVLSCSLIKQCPFYPEATAPTISAQNSSLNFCFHIFSSLMEFQVLNTMPKDHHFTWRVLHHCASWPFQHHFKNLTWRRIMSSKSSWMLEKRHALCALMLFLIITVGLSVR